MTSDVRLWEQRRLFIGGEWVEPHSDRIIESIEPATGQVWAIAPEADEVDVDNAVAAARAAFGSRAWRGMSGTERGGLLLRLAARVREEAGRLAELESRDNGMTIRDAKGDVGALANWLTYYAGLADKIEGRTIPANPRWHSYTLREPVGVVAAITPWNAPLLMYGFKLAPALAAGCTVVLKPAEQTPVTALEVARLVEEVGFPPGVVNVVPGYGRTGQALVKHPGVNKVAFTGEHTTAQHILANAATTLKRVSVECGGKAPHIIFADADLESAVNVAAAAAFRRTGQSCALGSRIFVQAEVHDRVVDEIERIASRIRVGDPLADSTHLGPQTFEEQLKKTEGYIKIGREEGARLRFGGERPALADERLRGGYFVSPTIFTDVTSDMRIAQEEIFGPVAAMIRFEDEDDLIQQANGVIYGLTAGVWTRDLGRAHRLAGALEAGSVWVNVYPAIHYALPYGGQKMSGLGRENGISALEMYTELKTIVIDFSDEVRPNPFAN
ncbi:MAG: aldehyde dehydrogenase [Candidatus Acidiferrales bacterium]